MIEINSPKKIKKIILEDGTEIEINLPPKYANLEGWQIVVAIPISPEDWKKFFDNWLKGIR